MDPWPLAARCFILYMGAFVLFARGLLCLVCYIFEAANSQQRNQPGSFFVGLSGIQNAEGMKSPRETTALFVLWYYATRVLKFGLFYAAALRKTVAVGIRNGDCNQSC